jgi:NADPH:quinone reductase-like Zn-dependent oxidoreductase
MDAAVLTEPGTPRFASFDEPAAADGHAVVDVLAAGLNPVDLAMASGRFPVPLTFPCVAGREGVGATADGRRVYFGAAVAPFGSMAPRTLVDPETCFAVPDGLDDGLAVALGIAGLAAWLPLTWAAQLQPGETVLVLGATGTLGAIAVQAARLLGAGRVVAAGRDAEGLRRARDRGAHATVDLSGDEADLPQALRDAAGGGVDVIVDPLWGPPALAALAAAHPFARLVQIGNSAAPEVTLAGGAFRQTSARIIGYTTRLVPLSDQRAAYAALSAHAAAGDIAVDVERIPLAQVETAWARQADHPHRKLVLVP